VTLAVKQAFQAQYALKNDALELRLSRQDVLPTVILAVHRLDRIKACGLYDAFARRFRRVRF
jgi:hypothetical protein